MKSLHRIGVFTLCLLTLAALTGILAKATATILTPNAAIVNYNLTAGGTSSPVTPITNQPVVVIGANTTATNFAVSTVTMIHIPSTMLKWVGQEAATGAVTRGGSTVVGTHIIWLDATQKVGLQVFSADQFVIHNGAATTQAGSVKLIW
jgi:hypothetical protein